MRLNFMRSKVFFRRSKVEYNVFWTFNLMKNAAIGWSNHYCNLQSNEKEKKLSISWSKKLLISCFHFMKFDPLNTSHPLAFWSYFLVFLSYYLVFLSYYLVFWSYPFVFLSNTFAFRSYFLSFIDLGEPPGSFWRNEI
jgi:hypothetical protein